MLVVLLLAVVGRPVVINLFLQTQKKQETGGDNKLVFPYVNRGLANRKLSEKESFVFPSSVRVIWEPSFVVASLLSGSDGTYETVGCQG